VYGKEDIKVSKKKNALQYLINQLKENTDIGLYYGGDFIRDYIYIDDCIDAINLVLTKGNVNEIYNIGNNQQLKFGDIITQAKDIIKSTSKISSIPPTEFHTNVQVKDMILDSNKLFDLGYKPKTEILSGLEKIIK
jgi:nucleoside-diphosphate-sugar epimerase